MAISAAPERRRLLGNRGSLAGDPDGLGQRVAAAEYSAFPLVIAVVWTLGFGAVFISRASMVLNGQRTFTLFDDAMVSMRYAHLLADGHGLVWNAGEPGVEGYTNFLWTLWMALLHRTGASTAVVGLLVSLSGLALLVANLFVVRALARSVAPDRRSVEITALALTATSYPLLYWTLRGMEVGLVALTLSTATLMALRVARDERAGIPLAFLAVLAVGLLTRTDTAVPLAAIGVWTVVASRPGRRLGRGVILVSAVSFVLIVHTLLRLRWYGELLPNTYALKLGGIPLADRLARGLTAMTALATVELLAPLVLAVVGFCSLRGRPRAEVGMLAAVVAACAAYAVYVGGDAWEWMRYADRYVAPALPLLFVLVGIGVDQVLRAAARHQRRLLLVLAGFGGLALAFAALDPLPVHLLQVSAYTQTDWAWREGAAVLAGPIAIWPAALVTLALAHRWVWPRTRGLGVSVVVISLVVATSAGNFENWSRTGGIHVDSDAHQSYVGAMLSYTTTPDTTIAVVWAGSVPYFSGRPAIDLLGKSDPVIAHTRPHQQDLFPGHMKWDYSYSIGQLRPDLVLNLLSPTEDDLARMVSWGYDDLGNGAWIRRDATGIDTAGLVQGLAG